MDGANLEVTNECLEKYTHQGDDFTSLVGETQWKRSWKRGDWNPSIRNRTVMACTESTFLIHADLDAYMDDRRVFCKSWQEEIPRHLV